MTITREIPSVKLPQKKLVVLLRPVEFFVQVKSFFVFTFRNIREVIFFENNEIRPSFIDANYTYDVVNEDTGKKIGSFGTVSEVFHKSLCLLSLVF